MELALEVTFPVVPLVGLVLGLAVLALAQEPAGVLVVVPEDLGLVLALVDTKLGIKTLDSCLKTSMAVLQT